MLRSVTDELQSKGLFPLRLCVALRGER